MKTLVTGGVRSGKSQAAEALLADFEHVTYIAPGYPADPADPEWSARITAHRASRPASWATVETADVASAVRALQGPAIVDCLGTWLTRQLDELDAWESHGFEDALRARIADLADAWSASENTLVAVTNEVGMGLVSEHRSGRVFADWLGRTNQAVAAASDDVILVVAGRQLRL